MGFRRYTNLYRKEKAMSKFTMPTHLQKEARDYMKDVIAMLTDNGVMEDVDVAALNMLAHNYNTFIVANKQLQKDGLTVTSDRGNISEHPLIKVAKDAQTQAMKVMVEFGLTAKSRAKLPQMENADSELSPLEQFVKSNREVR